MQAEPGTISHRDMSRTGRVLRNLIGAITARRPSLEISRSGALRCIRVYGVIKGSKRLALLDRTQYLGWHRITVLGLTIYERGEYPGKRRNRSR